MKSVFIHQPEYFPWIHYFEKMYLSDIIVFLDSVQYSRRGYQNRNLIYSTNSPKWITLPIHKSSRSTKINDIKINNEINWQKKHVKSIAMAYSNKKYFIEINNLFKNVFNKKWDYLCELNIYIIKIIMNYFHFNKPVYLLSELNIHNKKSDLILEICRSLNVKDYITGIGSKNYLDQTKFNKNDINIIYKQPKNNIYTQNSEFNFIPNLSILDYLYNNGSSIEFLK